MKHILLKYVYVMYMKIKSIKLLERNGFDKIHKSWFYQDVLYRKMLNK